MGTQVTDTQYHYVDVQNADGMIIGKTTTSKLAFFGDTPVSLPTGATQAAAPTSTITTAAVTTTTNNYGYATTTQANDIAAVAAGARDLVNQLRSDLVSLGLIQGS